VKNKKIKIKKDKFVSLATVLGLFGIFEDIAVSSKYQGRCEGVLFLSPNTL
jgi:hypothetical protein